MVYCRTDCRSLESMTARRDNESMRCCPIVSYGIWYPGIVVLSPRHRDSRHWAEGLVERLSPASSGLDGVRASCAKNRIVPVITLFDPTKRRPPFAVSCWLYACGMNAPMLVSVIPRRPERTPDPYPRETACD